jgi:hypothetical protein
MCANFLELRKGEVRLALSPRSDRARTARRDGRASVSIIGFLCKSLADFLYIRNLAA